MTSRRRRVLALCAAVALASGALGARPVEAKNKHKKAKKCAAYQPGELGRGADTFVVTDKATESTPIEVELSTTPGVGLTSTDPGGDTGATSHVYINVQVDTKANTTGLYVRTEFPDYADYDLFLRDASGSAVAYQGDFNPVAGQGLGAGSGGHSEVGAEALDGIGSADCTGYTLDVASAITPGGTVVVKLWLGEVRF
jgi:hypothetical protein